PFLYLELGLPQHVELHWWDADGAGLPQRGAVGRGVRDDQLQLTAPGRAVVVEDIVDVALQKRDFARERRRCEQVDGQEVGEGRAAWRSGIGPDDCMHAQQTDPAGDVAA